MLIITFIRVPSGSKTANSWLKFLDAVNAEYMWKPAQNMYVCGLHFLPKYVMTGSAGKTKISKDGFPTLMNQKIILEIKVTVKKINTNTTRPTLNITIIVIC